MKDEEQRSVDASCASKTPNPNWTRFGGLHQPKTATVVVPPSRLGTVREENLSSTPTGTSTSSNASTDASALNGGKPPRNVSADMPPPPARATIKPEIWSDDGYFDEKITVTNEREEAFRVYRANIVSNVKRDNDGSTSPTTTLVCLHGCPYSSLSWAPFVKAFRKKCKTQTEVEIYAVDLRNHGESLSMRDGGSDFSLKRMVEDVAMILKHMFTQTKKDRKCVLVGHSMGASVASSLAHREDVWTREDALNVDDRNRTSLAGLIVVDVVEGSALKALPMMSLQLLNRPTSFRTMRDAFRWSLGFGGTTKNVDSARISFPSQLKQQNNGNSISNSDSNSERTDVSSPSFTFRCDVVKTEPYWKEWYLGMSERFLNAKTSKALLLAGTDRLDTPLTIAQMQGKFQMVVFPNSGHAIQEDEPEKFTQVVQDFLTRYVQN